MHVPLLEVTHLVAVVVVGEKARRGAISGRLKIVFKKSTNSISLLKYYFINTFLKTHPLFAHIFLSCLFVPSRSGLQSTLSRSFRHPRWRPSRQEGRKGRTNWEDWVFGRRKKFRRWTISLLAGLELLLLQAPRTEEEEKGYVQLIFFRLFMGDKGKEHF